MSSGTTAAMRKKQVCFEDAHELFRQFKNIARDGFAGKFISALQNFCNQRQLLIEERRRLGSLSRAGSSHHVLPVGCVGVLAYFHNPSTLTYPLVDDLIAQLESDIGDVVAQLHTSTTQMTAVHKRLAEAASEMLMASSVKDGAHDRVSGYDPEILADAALSMARVCSEVRVWAVRTVTYVRSRLVDPLYEGVDAAVTGLSWWDATQLQPIDADKAWRLASDALLTDVAKILILAGDD
ncbi:Hypothetical protein, putative [Bodo saltans]|uniref:Uncharacterized protein n=1 Tax=Bodo saltans TaxID=75058 RepID=A0A0S4IVZ7_BODSA|nr:Hypothetical protein, putative [Bodo saltans]|eukprot:CUF67970.1 Hypothetical protein, putative [Bodo saltans]